MSKKHNRKAKFANAGRVKPSVGAKQIHNVPLEKEVCVLLAEQAPVAQDVDVALTVKKEPILRRILASIVKFFKG